MSKKLYIPQLREDGPIDEIISALAKQCSSCSCVYIRCDECLVQKCIDKDEHGEVKETLINIFDALYEITMKDK